jgi:hypothetical protein
VWALPSARSIPKIGTIACSVTASSPPTSATTAPAGQLEVGPDRVEHQRRQLVVAGLMNLTPFSDLKRTLRPSMPTPLSA